VLQVFLPFSRNGLNTRDDCKFAHLLVPLGARNPFGA
jgi:hypothetical protein